MGWPSSVNIHTGQSRDQPHKVTEGEYEMVLFALTPSPHEGDTEVCPRRAGWWPQHSQPGALSDERLCGHWTCVVQLRHPHTGSQGTPSAVRLGGHTKPATPCPHPRPALCIGGICNPQPAKPRWLPTRPGAPKARGAHAALAGGPPDAHCPAALCPQHRALPSGTGWLCWQEPPTPQVRIREAAATPQQLQFPFTSS